jgi:hypothetical protein
MWCVKIKESMRWRGWFFCVEGWFFLVGVPLLLLCVAFFKLLRSSLVATQNERLYACSFALAAIGSYTLEAAYAKATAAIPHALSCGGGI